MVALGYSNKEIAWRAAVSVKSIETYKARATEKLNLHSRAQIVHFAVTHGWMNVTDGKAKLGQAADAILTRQYFQILPIFLRYPGNSRAHSVRSFRSWRRRRRKNRKSSCASSHCSQRFGPCNGRQRRTPAVIFSLRQLHHDRGSGQRLAEHPVSAQRRTDCLQLRRRLRAIQPDLVVSFLTKVNVLVGTCNPRTRHDKDHVGTQQLHAAEHEPPLAADRSDRCAQCGRVWSCRPSSLEVPFPSGSRQRPLSYRILCGYLTMLVRSPRQRNKVRGRRPPGEAEGVRSFARSIFPRRPPIAHEHAGHFRRRIGANVARAAGAQTSGSPIVFGCRASQSRQATGFPPETFSY